MAAYLISDITVRDRTAFVEQARAWYRSPECAFALEMHDKALTRNLILGDEVNQPAAVK
jgi:uncharacterized protein (DUF1330 family)